MNILHISNTDVAGGRFTGFYMQQGVGSLHKSEMAVWSKTDSRDSIHKIPPHNKMLNVLVKLGLRLDARLGLDGLSGCGGWFLPKSDYFKDADIIHLHLIHNVSNISILSLPYLNKYKPLIWTIHDPWATTGGCEHSFDCDRWLTGCLPKCIYPRRTSFLQNYMPYLHWKVKRSIFRRTNITLIAASKWMQRRILKSPLLQHLPCYHIPFGIDLEIFRPRNKVECRQKLGIPDGHKIIAFRDVGLHTDRYKGTRWILEALKIYDPEQPTSLLIFEDGRGFQVLASKYSIIQTGWIDGDHLANALSAADVFLMPSIQETFGLMAVEAMACGTPVIVFDGTALPEIIRSPYGGVVVPTMNCGALAEAIKNMLTCDQLRNSIGAQARKIAEEEYDFKLYVQRHLAMYSNTIQQFYCK